MIVIREPSADHPMSSYPAFTISHVHETKSAAPCSAGLRGSTTGAGGGKSTAGMAEAGASAKTCVSISASVRTRLGRGALASLTGAGRLGRSLRRKPSKRINHQRQRAKPLFEVVRQRPSFLPLHLRSSSSKYIAVLLDGSKSSRQCSLPYLLRVVVVHIPCVLTTTYLPLRRFFFFFFETATESGRQVGAWFSILRVERFTVVEVALTPDNTRIQETIRSLCV